MASAKSDCCVKPVPMNGGDGIYGYFRNSSLQRRGLDIAMAMIEEAIAERLNVRDLLLSSSTFNIAGLGCSVGPNTFFVVQGIVEETKLECQTLDPANLDFQAFLNDQVANDFNMLFKSPPMERDYHVAAVPGSFHGRLFPKASLHFIHSSYAIQWLSRAPEVITSESSKERIYIANAPQHVVEAYQKQFASDMEIFLNSRAAELVSGGIMAILVPGSSNYNCTFNTLVLLLESALMDLVNLGVTSLKEVPSFNLPIYNPTAAELETLIRRNENFSVERIDPLVRPPQTVRDEKLVDMVIMHYRAGWGGLVEVHFGSDVVDHMFEQFKTNRDNLYAVLS